MPRIYPFILTFLFLFLGSQATAADTLAVQAQASLVLSSQELKAILAMADQGDAVSQNYLGFLYATGQTVTKDEKTAFDWFRKAADQGYPEALGNLALMYERGIGVTKNLRTALDMHRRAAMAGYPISMKRLASLHEVGFVGEERDPIKAEMWETRYKEILKTGDLTGGAADPRKAAEKAPVKAQAEKTSAAVSSVNTPPQAAVAAQGDAQSKPASSSSLHGVKATEKFDFIQVGGEATAREATELMQKIIEKNLLSKNTHIELVCPDADSCLISIGPFSDTSDAALQLAKINASIKSDLAPSRAQRGARQESAPVASAPESPAPAIPVAPAPLQKSETAPAQPTLLPITPRQATVIPVGDTSAELVEAPLQDAKVVRSRYYFIQMNAKMGFEDSMPLTHTLFVKELVQKTYRVKIENMDGGDFRISIGPFNNAREATQQLQRINQQAFQSLSIVAFERLAPISGNEDYQPFIQINALPTLEEAIALTQTLREKEFLAAGRFVEIVNYAAGSYRVRFGPFKGVKDAAQNMQVLKGLKLLPILINLKRLVPVEGE